VPEGFAPAGGELQQPGLGKRLPIEVGEELEAGLIVGECAEQ
jgi:hypothetical protein